MKYLSIIVFIVIPITFSNCLEYDELPPLTMDGKNTFGCLVNGQLWLPEGRLGKSGTYAEVYQRSDTLAVNIYSSSNASSIFMSVIDFPNLRIHQTYDFYNNKCCGLQYLSFDDNGSCSYEVAKTGYVTLSKWDPVKGILAGTFQFEAYSDECEGAVKITEGRFDIGQIVH